MCTAGKNRGRWRPTCTADSRTLIPLIKYVLSGLSSLRVSSCTLARRNLIRHDKPADNEFTRVHFCDVDFIQRHYFRFPARRRNPFSARVCTEYKYFLADRSRLTTKVPPSSLPFFGFLRFSLLLFSFSFFFSNCRLSDSLIRMRDSSRFRCHNF